MNSLKLRYGAFMLGVTMLIFMVCTAAVYLVYQGKYLFTILLLGVLYITTYQLGKRFTKIFFLLFFIRTLRKRGGTMAIDEYTQFIQQSLGKRRNDSQRLQLQKEILEDLEKEGIVSVVDENIYLLG